MDGKKYPLNMLGTNPEQSKKMLGIWVSPLLALTRILKVCRLSFKRLAISIDVTVSDDLQLMMRKEIGKGINPIFETG